MPWEQPYSLFCEYFSVVLKCVIHGSKSLLWGSMLIPVKAYKTSKDTYNVWTRQGTLKLFEEKSFGYRWNCPMKLNTICIYFKYTDASFFPSHLLIPFILLMDFYLSNLQDWTLNCVCHYFITIPCSVYCQFSFVRNVL